tara:strand:+ start:84 stop:731 length:648 start_codon:yes stop_codon:yes gene_type:complete
MITNNIIKRFFTSILLLVILYFALINNGILILTLFSIIYILLIEFNYIFKKMFNKNKLFNFLFLFTALTYLIFFSLLIFIFLQDNNQSSKQKIIFILSICISTDLGGYLFGKLFKGKKLTSLSPNKTYSGMIGSFFLSLIVASIFFKNLELEVNIFLLTLIISFVSQIGDLFISLFKRKAKIKDTGKILPGHGGLLDRLDGILFAIPVGLFLVSL